MKKYVLLITILFIQLLAYQQLPAEDEPSSSTVTSVPQSAAEEPIFYDQLPSAEQMLKDLNSSAEPPGVSKGDIGPSRSVSHGQSTGCRSRPVSLPSPFLANSAEITPAVKQSIQVLDKVFSNDQFRDCHFQIEGHTDSTGSTARNKQLSLRRAEAIKTYLVNEFSFPYAQLQATGAGEARPLKRFKSTDPQQRRIQVRISGH